jgi:hypothetical protein
MTIEVELSDELAWAFAEFLKRAGYSDYRQLAVDEQEAYAMRDAGEKVRTALAEKGYAPR